MTSTPVDATLSFRRAGSTDWVDIDPRTARGQRLLALFGITTKENKMSAATAETFGPGPRLRPVTDPQAARMGLLLRTRIWAQRMLAKMRASARNAWGWIERTFHLEAAKDYVASAYGWAREQMARGMSFLGGSGAAGLGLLAIATEGGRRVLGLIWRPFGWALKMLLKGWVFVEDSLQNGKGGIRSWLSERMADVRELFIGNIAEDGDKKGIIGAGIGLYFKYVYPHLRLDSLQMKGARSLGALMFGLKIVAAIAFLPFGATAISIFTILGYAGVAYAATAPFADEIDTMRETVTGWFSKEKREAKKEARKADRHGEQTVNAVEKEMEEAKAEADAKLAAEEAANGDAPNRASRRATKQTAGSGGRRR